MAEEKTMRLSQVARKLNVGRATIIDFLKDKGEDIDSNPNSKISGEQYAMLSKEFATSASEKEEASSLTIGVKHDDKNEFDVESETLKKELDDEEDSILIKNVSVSETDEKKGIEVKKPEKIVPEVIEKEAPKLKGIKVLGKIDLDLKSKKKSEETKVEKESEKDQEDKKEEESEKITEEVKVDKVEESPVAEKEAVATPEPEAEAVKEVEEERP
ncbi:MAG: translation initiation factor IF-2 N-terminal domain-containing protein, partial [Cyclobacteriaceae bacterium]|nr:translation initiation factor IF-2 N-terminal domain-containing protein [Cyclobacteriaceae bacterium]